MAIRPAIIENKIKNNNLWNIGTKSFYVLKKATNSSKTANIVIPSIFIFTGIGLIWQYAKGEIVSVLQEINGNLNQGYITLVDSDYIDLITYISKPIGLDRVTTEAFGQKVLKPDPISNTYAGTFYISIPSIGINKLPVKGNVDSTTEEIYSQVLENSLAHFKNTGLPISNIKNNIVIYGHSASSGYNPSPNDPVVAFSFLRNLQIGDEIIVEIDNQTFRYKMSKSKIVEPNDFSIINGEADKRQLTLFTCDPPGNNSNRLAVIARPV